MANINKYIDSFDTSVKGALSVVEKNEYLSSIVILILILYAGLAAPKLPAGVATLFDYTIVKLAIFFAIVYVAKRNPTVAIIASIAVMISLLTLNKLKLNELIKGSFINRQFFGKRSGRNQPTKQEHDTLVLAQTEEHLEHDDQEVGFTTNVPNLHVPVPAPAPKDSKSCVKNAQYRNSFYPQYVNMKPDSYMARYNESDVMGYDATANYNTSA